MMNTKLLSMLLTAALAIGLANLSSCASAQNLDEVADQVQAGADTLKIEQTPIVDEVSDLPDCDTTNQGTLYFVIADSSFQYCTVGGYLAYKLAGAQQVVSSCAVHTNLDKTKTITCTDGTKAVLTDGTNGLNGQDGENGANGSDGANGSAGVAGSSGSAGADAKPCTMSDDGMGTLTMTCGETVKSWPKAVCNVDNMRSDEVVDVGLVKQSLVLAEPYLIPYDPATMSCTPMGLMATCGERFYNVLTQFCDTRDSMVYDYTVIGDQAWMADDLNYRGKNNDLGVPGYGSSSASSGTYYEFAEVISKTDPICPEGWSMPQEDDFESDFGELSSFIFEDMGASMQPVDNDLKGYGWKYYEVRDPYGFNALPTGHIIAGNEDNYGTTGTANYWTATSIGPTEAYSLSLVDVLFDEEVTPEALDAYAKMNKKDMLTVRCFRKATDSEKSYFTWFREQKVPQ